MGESRALPGQYPQFVTQRGLLFGVTNPTAAATHASLVSMDAVRFYKLRFLKAKMGGDRWLAAGRKAPEGGAVFDLDGP